MENNINHSVAVIGAGPAGLFAASHLAKNGAQVALINRDIKYGGLAEYGIFHNKHKMKNGLRKQFHKVIDDPNIHYFGNVSVGQNAHLRIADLKEMGFSAILVTVGAQGTKWLGLPGEDLEGVYHAKDLVYHYNQLPPYSSQDYPIGKKVTIIGVGNVMLDIAHWAIRDLHVDQVISIARRGPADVKFTKKEMSLVFKNLNLADLDSEFDRAKDLMESVGQGAQAAKDFIFSAEKSAQESVSDTDFKLSFLQQPKQIIGDGNGKVIALEVEETTLKLREDGKGTRSIGLGKTKRIETDSVVFCIGDQVDQQFGLPLDKWGEFAKSPTPAYPIEDVSFEAYDLETNTAIDGVFLAGWAREASSGLVGTARKDGVQGAKALAEYLGEKETSPPPVEIIQALQKELKSNSDPFVTSAEIKELTLIENAIAEKKELPFFKFSSNEDMLEALKLVKPA